MSYKHVGVLFFVAFAATAVASDQPAAPAAVTATISPDAALVAWTPVEGAEAYKVYGSGSSTPLDEVSDVTSTVVPGGHSTYGVSAVTASGESTVTWVSIGECVDVWVHPLPPGATVGSCGSGRVGVLMTVTVPV